MPALLLYLSLLLSLTACRLQKIGKLPDYLKENSGLSIDQHHNFYWHNDSGDGPHVYSSNAQLKNFKKHQIPNAQNIDWEDISLDFNTDKLFIADIGNNNQNRTEFQIYAWSPKQSQTSQTISFYYPERKQGPLSAKERFYDAEGLFYYQDFFYLINKNRSKPQTGWTRLYKVPNQASQEPWPALVVDSFFSGQKHWLFSPTGAALSKDGKILALISARRLWLFEDFQAPQFFQARCCRNYRLPLRQWEALSFDADGNLYLSCEASPLGQASCWRFRYQKKRKRKHE